MALLAVLTRFFSIRPEGFLRRKEAPVTLAEVEAAVEPLTGKPAGFFRGRSGARQPVPGGAEGRDAELAAKGLPTDPEHGGFGMGACIGETVRRSNPAWTWEFPDPPSGELPRLLREGPGGVGRMVYPAAKMALARLREDELALLTRQEMREADRLFACSQKHPDFWAAENGRAGR